jgi:DNA-binding MarR family transcriptional regulator
MNTVDTYRLINEVFLLGDDIDRQLFSRFSLTVRQYHLLNWLHNRGQANLSELAQLLLCDKSNVTGIVRRLKTARLIEEVATTDRRFTRVRLTEKGQQIHDLAMDALKHSIQNRFATVSEGEHQQIQQLLVQMHDHLRHYIDGQLALELSDVERK